MEFLVCISKAPDTTTRIAFTEGDTRFSEEGVQFIVNPYDEWYALVRALELVEAGGGKVVIVSVGGPDCDPILRKALAIGAHEAVRIDANPTDAGQVAAEIAAYAKDKGFDAILCGKETIDHNGSAVPAMLAEHLDVPCIALCTSLDYEGDKAILNRETAKGIEKVAVSGPFVLSAAKGMAEQRIPNMRGIMAARTKPLNLVPAAGSAAGTTVEKFALPAAKAGVKLVDADNPTELVHLLREEAKVI
ncbi:MAG: electron transfer flavoprotein subunit alpha [Flavobacteriales bacterium]|nr:electron transfer flavoprotein subunit alpha [Flavobacteriales bacterium]